MKHEQDPTPSLPVVAAYSTWVAFNAQTATLIWSRFSGMLASNALLVGVLGLVFSQTSAPLERSVTLIVVASLGLLLTTQWKVLNSAGWDALKFVQTQLKSFTFDGSENPMVAYDAWRDHGRHRLPGDSNRTFTAAGIVAFAGVYLLALLAGIVTAILTLR